MFVTIRWKSSSFLPHNVSASGSRFSDEVTEMVATAPTIVNCCFGQVPFLLVLAADAGMSWMDVMTVAPAVVVVLVVSLCSNSAIPRCLAVGPVVEFRSWCFLLG